MHEDKRPARFAIVGVPGEEREQLAARTAQAGGNLVDEERPGQRFERAGHEIGQRQAGGHAIGRMLPRWMAAMSLPRSNASNHSRLSGMNSGLVGWVIEETAIYDAGQRATDAP